MKFSIIVPVYNVQKYLCKCLDSILNQTYKNYEIILIDDGSTDNSSVICDKYKLLDNRIRVIHKKNGGLSSARNVGICNAIGDYIIFIDSDDYWTNNTILLTINDILEQIATNAIIAWDYIKVNDDKCSIDVSNLSFNKYNIKNDYINLLTTGKLFACSWYMAIPKYYFEQFDLSFEENVTSEDVEWFARLLLISDQFVYINSKFYAYRQRKGSISNLTNKKTVISLENHIDKMIRMLPNKIIFSYLSEQICNYFIVLSHYSRYKEHVDKASKYKYYLKHVVRKRSKLIKYSVTIIGLRKTLILLKILRKVI